MRWSPGGMSSNIEDRRGRRAGGIALAGGGGLVMLVLSLIFGRDVVGMAEERTSGGPDPEYQETPAERKQAEFVSFVLDDSQKVWHEKLPGYRDAKLVLFTDSTRSGCGVGEAAMGPFYCPADEKVYIDLGFFNELDRRFGAPGDFAQAYVIAHEIGHHVQHQMGTDRKVRQMQQSNPRDANELSVRLELQADCYAGVWANSTGNRELLEEGDIEEGLGAAAAVGDDRIQKQATGRVNPEKWTHGSAQQRSTWFRRGLESGRVEECDTFR